MKLRIVISFLLFAWPLIISAQQANTQDSKGTKINLLHADTTLILQSQGQQITKLIGDVKLYQDSVFMTCDSAILVNEVQVFAYDSVTIQQGDSVVAFANYLEYNGDTRKAYLEEDVILVNGTQQLFTDRLDYDLNTKIATYYYGATLVNDSTQLSSKRGYYYVDQEEAYFKDSVQVSDPQFYLRADTLKINLATNTVFFLGPTLINADSSDIYCEAGYYDTENGLAEFTQNAQFQKEDRQAVATKIRFVDAEQLYILEGNAQVRDSARFAKADTIRYFQATDESYLIGNATFRDDDRNISNASKIYYNGETDTYSAEGQPIIKDGSQILEAENVKYDETLGLGIASGNVMWQDTSANIAINSDSVNYRQEVDYLKAIGGPNGRPELIAIMEGDSLFMASDTLISRRIDTTGVDSARVLSAFNRVRIFKSDLQGLCDSMAYSAADSLFRLFRDPLLWADSSTQFKADTITIQMANDAIDKVYLMGNAIIINEVDGTFYNQIKGKFITAFFKDGSMYKMKVKGNAETIYYAKDDKDAYLGVDQSICSELMVYFAENEVQKIKFYKEPQSSLIPMSKADHNALRLKGFEWLIQLKPMAREDIFAVTNK